ncbi:Endoplasmic reticulum aminopeptidase 1 [Stylophora pistillata]|uniref:Endoplasmic reticulum aminopeptidase 1 n=1 Tax=Stylophora pistillata TaxID=50429 RepID=A0A2B4RVZ5_STYPI|nr:Endoplasmic reticulum aminopeptidase 1 [Stylophora pistillata]
MPLESRERRRDGLVESHFSASVPMPTYLVAFIVCDFEYKETKTKSGRKIRVWSKPDAINSVDFALDVAKRALEFYEDFFKVPYPLPKLDLIAIPDMGGAMENWGLVTFRESAVLFDPDTGSVGDKKLVTMIVNHELAHQWFGNLVTMKWWNDLWLNEGFAVYMEYLATDNCNNQWKREDQFILDTSREALDVDSSIYTHPVSVKVHNQAEINEIVDKITYHKSSAVIRMMQNFLGMETFRKGIQIYLNDHQFSNAKALDLWKAMSLATGSRIDVATVMAPWVRQKGFPVISIISVNTQKKDGHLLYTASQKRFFRDFTSQHLKDGHKETPGWYIPLTYITKDSLGAVKTVWMNNTSVTFQLSSSNSGWFKANVGQTGFYRVNYDDENWKRLSQQLLHNHTVLSPSDRSGLIDDALSLAKAGVLEYKTALQMIEYLNHELEYVPWAVTLRSLAYTGNMLNPRAAFKLYQQFIVEKIKHLGMILRWENTGELIDKSLRDLTLSTLCSHGDTECVNKSKKLFNDWLMVNGSKPIVPHLRKTVYYTAVKYGGQIEWEILWTKYKECKNAAEREKIIFALGATRVKNLLKRLLKKALGSGSEVRCQDLIQIIGTVASNPDGRLLAWKFFHKNFKKIVKRFGKESRTISFLLEKTTENLRTRKDLREVKDFFEAHRKMHLIQLSSKKILETIETNIHWMHTKIQQVERWLMDQQNK